MKAKFRKVLRALFDKAYVLAYIVCIGVTILGLGLFLISGGADGDHKAGIVTNHMVMTRYNEYITNSFSDSLEGIMSIKKVYWLSDHDIVAPKPDPAGYGETNDPSKMQSVLDQAAELLDGQETIFTTDVVLCPGSKIRYYYDPTILVITWQEVRDGSVYTMGEVKIADASQFRRFLSDGQYSSGVKYLSSEMAKSVNAVLASNGDYYANRRFGTVVYNGQLMRTEGRYLDSCYIDDKGDMKFLRAGEITSEAEMERYIQENNIRFNIAFGPILIEDGKTVPINRTYLIGEVTKFNERAALCQKGELHYLLVLANPQPPYGNNQVLWRFAEQIQSMGVDKAYNLDGGRSGTMVINGKRINQVDERKLSDIIYFATAISSE